MTTPSGAELILDDLRTYLGGLNVRLSDDAFRIFVTLERNAEALDAHPFGDSLLLALLEGSPSFANAVDHFGGSSAKAAWFARSRVSQRSDNYPYVESALYSDPEEGRTEQKLRVLDLAVTIARAADRREVTSTDVIEAVLRQYDELYPFRSDADDWKDNRLRTSPPLLARLAEEFDESLDVRFSDIRHYFGTSARPHSPADLAPARLRNKVRRLQETHPHFHRNCFVIMSFDPSRGHQQLFEALVAVLAEFGLQPLRADHAPYSDDLLDNVLTYAHGCSFAIAVHEKLEQDAHNANVAFEVGYMYALDRPVCLLKERTVERLPSDLVGRLYVEFDQQELTKSLRKGLKKWLSAAGIVWSA